MNKIEKQVLLMTKNKKKETDDVDDEQTPPPSPNQGYSSSTQSSSSSSRSPPRIYRRVSEVYQSFNFYIVEPQKFWRENWRRVLGKSHGNEFDTTEKNKAYGKAKRKRYYWVKMYLNVKVIDGSFQRIKQGYLPNGTLND